jgi:hypothetical protein
VLTSTYLFAEDVAKTKTFDSDRIIDYTFEYKHGSQVYRLFYTYDKNTNTAGIKYSPDNHFIQFNDLKPILLRLIQKAEAHDRGKLNYFMTFEYLGCDDLYMKSIRAFHKQKNWEEYLAASKKRWTTPPYELIKGRIISKDVFSELAPLFSEIGYEIRFSSYEKLAVQKAGEFDFYNDLKQYGIQPNDKFPVPLILYFSLKSGE